MMLAEGERIANHVIEVLRPACSKIEVAGSIRRCRPFVHDIDIVAIPANQGQFLVALRTLGKAQKAGPKLMTYLVAGQAVDIYIADERSWPTLFLIRTGSKEHNVRLCARAKQLSMTLHADGSGIEDKNGPWIPPDERSIFDRLRVDWLPPQMREVGKW